MDILIIEDEIPAQQLLIRLIKKYFSDFKIIGSLDSISSALKWLKHNHADIIFMDVELSDGKCFELFNKIEINSPVIITTAYEQYALNAFKVKCIDYLLKPIIDEDFIKSVNRCISFCNNKNNSIESTVTVSPSSKKQIQYKQRFTINIGDQIIIVNTNDIAYFLSESKSSYIVLNNNKKYLCDESLDSIEEELDPSIFFKLSRGCITSVNAILNISKYFNSRLKVTLQPRTKESIIVSRARSQNFLKWIEGKN